MLVASKVSLGTPPHPTLPLEEGRALRLRDVSLSVAPGEVVALVGPNGAGKSSLLACLAGLLTPDAGAVALDGVALGAMTPRARARAIGALPQLGEVAWDMPVATLVGLGRLPWDNDGARAVETALTAMELTGLQARPISRLSGGERARVLLARVLAGEPRYILADEPLASLDLAHAAGLMARLRAEAADGIGVVVAMHDLACAMNHASRVVVMAGGGVIADDVPERALAEAIIARVWGVTARWWGERGERALAVGPGPLARPEQIGNCGTP